MVGASGVVFGLFGAVLAGDAPARPEHARQMLVLLAINGAIGFFVPDIAWQAHLGGLVTGALVALRLRLRAEGAPGRRRLGVPLAGVAPRWPWRVSRYTRWESLSDRRCHRCGTLSPGAWADLRTWRCITTVVIHSFAHRCA